MNAEGFVASNEEELLQPKKHYTRQSLQGRERERESMCVCPRISHIIQYSASRKRNHGRSQLRQRCRTQLMEKLSEPIIPLIHQGGINSSHVGSEIHLPAADAALRASRMKYTHKQGQSRFLLAPRRRMTLKVKSTRKVN